MRAARWVFGAATALLAWSPARSAAVEVPQSPSVAGAAAVAGSGTPVVAGLVAPVAAGPGATEPNPEFDTPAPPFVLDHFPCTRCHDAPTNPAPRELGFHDEMQPLAHGPTRWCLDCHDFKNRDVLHLSSGAPVPFEESYRLCGQCHGDKLRDWRVGVHGKRTGSWNGKKAYLLCVNCHNPHAPKFTGVETVTLPGAVVQRPTAEQLRPDPRPRKPAEIR